MGKSLSIFEQKQRRLGEDEPQQKTDNHEHKEEQQNLQKNGGFLDLDQEEQFQEEEKLEIDEDIDRYIRNQYGRVIQSRIDEIIEVKTK